ncbi:DUF4097 domain-containing protein [candidate division KSB1 bacterium]|nr:DUF4097 domain-containing protein [candidate division KSB1 bacterium]NIR68661.1 DUF4097 domain-containing protein [candidate division KSB1 bacterium]NIS27150.1 DUF4097 domain-containing protein [candidate division KSB1 bacterium]NIT74036.1 DUF4097 domain-containing protein [candidate division KSB1 bacterium]NIU27902.1 DUF4097 domain-containing protein [candidate division KSB1 bacterium]
MRKHVFTIASLICVAVFSTLSAGTLREHFDETYRLDKGGTLLLSNTNGSITVESWDRNEVRIEAEKRVKARDRRLAEEVMEELKIDIRHKNDYIEIDTKIPKRRRGFLDSFFGDNVSVSVQYRLKVPSEVSLDISTVNGPVEVSEVTGKMEVRSTNGRIEIQESKGSIRAKTTNGGIEVELLEFDEDEDMYFKTTNGGITVYFPENFRAYVDARTTNGGIKTDFPIEVRGEISKKRLKGAINGGGGRIELHTTNGGIRIRER